MTRREIFESLLSKGLVMVALDARHPEVEVPTYHKADMRLCLNFSHHFKDGALYTDDRGVHEILTFNSRPFAVFVPWVAIHGMMSKVTGASLMFPDSMPPEVIAAPELPELPGSQSDNDTPLSPKLQQLSDAIAAAPDGTFEPAPSPSGRPALRLIKGGKS